MTNFDFLLQTKDFATFADVAVSAEKILHIDAAAAVINCRRAMEFAVKWMYSVDSDLVMPYQDNLGTLMDAEEFRKIVEPDVYRRMGFIRKIGNIAAHAGKKVSEEQAMLCLEDLYYFMDFVAYCYAPEYTEGKFDPELVNAQTETLIDNSVAINFDELLKENEALKAELTARRAEQQQTYAPPKPLDCTEYETRKVYIDTMLQDAGWTEGRDWINEYELFGMPNKSDVGYADYVLFGDDGKPLALIEAKRTCKDVFVGRQQAKLYADLLEKKYRRRPVIFLSNGFDTRIDDGVYPERKVAAIYSKRDLEKLFNLRTVRTSLEHVEVDKNIAGRYYQEGAIKAVCDSFGRKNRRKALLVMATGSGKTRTVMALCDVLLRHGWVKNILFLADRTSLVLQAKRSFVNLLPDLSVSNLCEDKENYNARCIFSTYQTMANCIDEVRDDDGKLFSTGHFDLVICDEAHRSIYNKYRDIFNYFDAPLVGLTATPKDDIDKNTYEIFELENGVPTYGYELSQAVEDGFLVDFMSIETKLKFIEQGIVYDDLSDEDKAEYEETFSMEGELPERIGSSALNEWIFNEDTIREVLHVLMSQGLRIDYGEKIGKTIIFAKNHRHAEKIYDIFGKEYPHLAGYAKVIDNHINYAQSAIDEFSNPKKLPQIAISVDMLDTGIDVPEVLNLVFFKKVMSKAKFWQMIGRGTRLCEGLIDGQDKKRFYIFDFCGNFEFFRMNKGGNPAANTISLQGAIFKLKAQIVFKLQDIAYQTEELIAFRKSLIDDMVEKVSALNRENFAVRQHLRYVDTYANPDNYKALTYEDTLDMGTELAPLIEPDKDEVNAVRFDALMYGIELCYLAGKSYSRAKSDLFKKVSGIASVAASFPEIKAQGELIDKILNTSYLENCGINEFEHIRKALRDLAKFIPHGRPTYITHFDDEILSMEWKQSELDGDELKNYRAKAEYYVRQHVSSAAISKLRTNIPLSADDVEELEKALWGEVGTKADYENEYGSKPLGEFIREIVGMDMNAAKAAFAEYLNGVNLDANQIYFVNQIVEYIVRNGMMKDLSVMMEAPFTDHGSVSDVFDMPTWLGIRSVIERINANASVQ